MRWLRKRWAAAALCLLILWYGCFLVDYYRFGRFAPTVFTIKTGEQGEEVYRETGFGYQVKVAPRQDGGESRSFSLFGVKLKAYYSTGSDSH